MKTILWPIILFALGCQVRAQTVFTLDTLPNQFTTAETNALVLIQRNPGTPQRATGAIPIGLLPIVGGGGNATNAVTSVTGDVIGTGPGATPTTIATGAVSTAKLADGAVNSAKLGAGAVGTAHVLDGAVTTSKIADSSVAAAKVAPDAITTVKILDANVTGAKLADAAVTTSKLVDANVTLAKLAAASVDSSKIVDGTIITADLANASVTDAKVEWSVAGVTSSGGTLSFDLGGARRQTNSESGSLTVAIVNKPSTSVDRWRIAQFFPSSTLNLTWPSTVSGSSVRWLGTPRTSIAGGTLAEVAIGWNGSEVLLTEQQPQFTTGVGITNINSVLSINLTAGLNTTLTTNANGEVSIASSGGGGNTNAIPPLFVQRSDFTVANTTTETSLLGSLTGSATLPANFFAQGKNVRLVVYGRISTKASGPGTFSVKGTVGGTSVALTGTNLITSALTNTLFYVQMDVACRTAGASGTVKASGFGIIGGGTGAVPIFAEMVSTGTTTVDTTSTLAFDITWQWGTADTANTITLSNAVLSDGPGGGGGSGGGGGGGSSVSVDGSNISSANFKSNFKIKHPVSGSDITDEDSASVTLTDGATISTDATTGNYFRVTLGGDRTLANPTGLKDRAEYIWEITQDATGNRHLILGSNFNGGDTVPLLGDNSIVLSTGASKRDRIKGIYHSPSGKIDLVAFSVGH